MISHQEMRAQQVASYLTDYEDHLTSHKLCNLYWVSFERFVDRDEPTKSVARASDMTGEPGNSDSNGMGDGCDVPESAGPHDEMAIDDEDEGEVSITVEQDETVAKVADQVVDYTMRAEEMSDLCLWDFVATSEKIGARKSAETQEDSDNESGGDGELVRITLAVNPILRKVRTKDDNGANCSRDYSPGSCRFFIYFRPAKTTKFYGANPVSSSHPCLE